jgi:hypothetical protein
MDYNTPGDLSSLKSNPFRSQKLKPGARSQKSEGKEFLILIPEF